MKEKNISRLSSGIFLITVLGILILVNIISMKFFGRIDLTENDMFTLSKASKDLMENLDDQVYVEAYFTNDLPAPYNHHTRFLKDLFEEYTAYSGGKFKFKFIDPGVDEEKRNELMLLGIPPVRIQEIQNDKFEVKQAFLGVVFNFRDKKEIIPVVKSTHNLEYEITSTVRKLIASKLKVIGFLQGHSEPVPRETMKQAVSILEKNFTVKEIDLSDSASEIPVDVDALVIISPTEKFDKGALYQIDQYLMKGRSIAFFTDSVNVDLNSFKATNIDSGLSELIKHYGITINTNLVGDIQSQRINVTSQQGMFKVTNVVDYPLIPVVTEFDKDVPLTSKLDAMAFPFISSLTINKDNDQIKYKILARTSPRSWLQKGLYKINPTEDLSPGSTDEFGPFPVIAIAQGGFQSYFANKLETSDPEKPYMNPNTALKQSPDTRILVIGDGSFAQDQFGDRSGASAVFFADCMDWLVQDEGLISIRGRGIQNKPLMELESWQKGLIKYLNIIGIPFLLVLFGLMRWSFRKAKRANFKL